MKRIWEKRLFRIVQLFGENETLIARGIAQETDMSSNQVVHGIKRLTMGAKINIESKYRTTKGRWVLHYTMIDTLSEAIRKLEIYLKEG